jgi:anti-sigma regulatory factor (Ser/Thr protein kinase)
MGVPSIPIHDPSDAAAARHEAAVLARQTGFDETKVGKLSIVVTELATNVLKHGGGGEMIVRLLEAETAGIEILALDKGAGMRDVDACMRDGYSTSCSPGTGLGAIGRLSSFVDIYSQPGRGTAVLVRLCGKRDDASQGAQPPAFEIGGVSVPIAGETANGDGWAVRQDGETVSVLMVDGIGHGPAAAQATRAAIAVFDLHRDTPAGMIERIHGALRSTRGAAVAVTDVNAAEQSVKFAGVGNISGQIRNATGTTQMVSHNGTAGHEVYKIQQFQYAWPQHALLILHSDGLSRSWDLAAYPGLALRDPSLVAGVLYRDVSRGRDDATVVVLRRREEGP